MDREQTEEIAGTLWTESEISAVVDSYFQMLTSERAGVAYSKAQNRRQLMTTVHRSEGLIERKLQNISAVLDMLGTQVDQRLQAVNARSGCFGGCRRA
ncbi:hypothetical protein IVB38_26015 [Bradyrhizobium sp. 38]|uniref:hypothetical protein n=1 Tax=unclassified Bradyrhizobium TaxID=2631580 RepID=UPI001FFB59D1|nr:MULTISPECIES: hypothetical protein [unclassified Bradyrhizobium]MCK1339369.1 hypothetical protein [Bradyrhizobium sp. 38]MCK1776008.1 hypothetical protein [Bradyrhizobium sp. 132]